MHQIQRNISLMAGAMLCEMLCASLATHAYAQPMEPIGVAPKPKIENRVDFRGAAVLRGRVQFSDGRAAANVPVSVEMTGRWKSLFGRSAGYDPRRGYTQKWTHLARAETITNAQGEYEIRGLGGAAYDVRAKIREGNRVFSGPEGFASLPVLGVHTQNGKVARAEAVTLESGAVIEGRVVDAASGVGLRGLSVGADGTGDAWGLRLAVDVTDGEGRFSLRVPAGRFHVGISGGGSRVAGFKPRPRAIAARRVSDGAALQAPLFERHVAGRDYVFTARGGAIVESASEAVQVLEGMEFLVADVQALEGQTIPLSIKGQQVELQLAPRQP